MLSNGLDKGKEFLLIYACEEWMLETESVKKVAVEREFN